MVGISEVTSSNNSIMDYFFGACVVASGAMMVAKTCANISEEQRSKIFNIIVTLGLLGGTVASSIYDSNLMYGSNALASGAFVIHLSTVGVETRTLPETTWLLALLNTMVCLGFAMGIRAKIAEEVKED